MTKHIKKFACILLAVGGSAGSVLLAGQGHFSLAASLLLAAILSFILSNGGGETTNGPSAEGIPPIEPTVGGTLPCGHPLSCMEESHCHLMSGELAPYPLNVCIICPLDDPRRKGPLCIACQAAMVMLAKCADLCADLAMRYELSSDFHKVAGEHELGYACRLSSVSLRDREKEIRKITAYDAKWIQTEGARLVRKRHETVGKSIN